MTDGTRAYYDGHVQEYAVISSTYDLTPLWDAFAKRVPSGGRVMDLGCGSGRDMVALSLRGLALEGIEYSEPMAEFCREKTGFHVTVADLRQHVFQEDTFAGIWCLATLLHIPRRTISDVLRQLYDSLMPNGVLMTSMQRGVGANTAADGRWFELYEPEEWSGLLREKGFLVEAGPIATTPSDRTSSGSVTWFVTYGRKPIECA